MDGNGVQDEFLRLMRAIYDSLERESELQRQLRRTKEALVSVALRLQVAIKLSKEDEQTLAQLAAEAEESKARELAATKRADEAVTLIRALTIEVNSLKRQLKAYETDKADSRVEKSSSGISLHQQMAMNDAADKEVDAMLAATNNDHANNNNGSNSLSKSKDASIALKNVSELAMKTATPFDKWKMTHFLYTPDTPAASLEHDKHVVDILMESATQDLIDDIRSKRTYSSLGKVKKLQKRITNEQDRSKMMSMTAHPANDYEGLCLPDTVTGINSANLALSQVQNPSLEQPLPPLNATEKELADFFISTGVEQKWGNRQTFDHSNLARVNLWASNDELHPVNSSKPKPKGNSSHNKAGSSPIKSPMKLQSLTQSSSSYPMYKSN